MPPFGNMHWDVSGTGNASLCQAQKSNRDASTVSVSVCVVQVDRKPCMPCATFNTQSFQLGIVLGIHTEFSRLFGHQIFSR